MLSGLTVVKVGGNEIDDAGWVARLASEVAAHGGPLVVVHGGGKEVTALERRLGIETEWRDGLRVTTEATLRATVMVVSGLVNKRLVAALVGAGTRALGLSGEDAGLLQAGPVEDRALGRVGEIECVRVDLLEALIRAGFTPVLSPLSRGPDGGALNVNADDAACAVAVALGAARLLFVSNVPGVHADGCVLPVVGEAERLIAAGVVGAGMVPKLRAAARAAAGGVADVRIGDLALLGDAAAGTRVAGRPIGIEVTA